MLVAKETSYLEKVPVLYSGLGFDVGSGRLCPAYSESHIFCTDF